MARKRTVLTPSAPRASRAKGAAPEAAPERVLLPGTRYRLRITGTRPEGGFPQPIYGDDLEALREAQGGLEWDGEATILEELVGPDYVAVDRARPLLVEELAKRGLARPHPAGGYTIEPEGQELLRGRRG